MPVAPEAGFGPPLVAVTLRTLRFRTLVGVVASTLGSGRRIGHHPMVHERIDVTRCRVVGHGPFPYQIDGDYLGETTELDIAYEPDVLSLVLPVTDDHGRHARN